MQNETFRESLAAYAGEAGPAARVVRVLRRRVPGDWTPTEQNTKALPAALVATWRELWAAWNKDNPAPHEEPEEADDGLAYNGVIRHVDSYSARFTIAHREILRHGFPTAQAAARFHDLMRRELNGDLRRLNFPTPEEKRGRKYTRITALATIKAKEVTPLRTDVPGKIHGVTVKGGCITAMQGGKYLGSFPDLRSACIAYNAAVLAATRGNSGRKPVLNYIEPIESELAA